MFRVILRSVLYYWRTNFVVLLAVVISTSVIGGSLIVGDSVRTSLQQMTLSRLGTVSHILHAPRFFRQQLASEIQAEPGLSNSALTDSDSQASKTSSPSNSTEAIAPADDQVVVPAILLTGTVERATSEQSRLRAGSVTLLGVLPESWSMLQTGDAPLPSAVGIVLGHRTATELQASRGDQVSVWIERPSSIPRDSLLGEREDVNLEIVLTVEAVLSEHAGASRFSLNPGQQLPYNAFVSLDTLQDRLGLRQVEATRRNPLAKPARVNALIAGKVKTASDTFPDHRQLPAVIAADLDRQDQLTRSLVKTIQLEDVGLTLRMIPERGYLSAESDSMILDDSTADAVITAAEHLGVESIPTLVYLANEIRADDQSNSVATNVSVDAVTEQADTGPRYSMYSIIAGMPFNRVAPLGPLVPADQNSDSDLDAMPQLKDDEIILSDWLSRDLRVAVGDRVTARWHDVGSHGDLPETHRSFIVRGILKSVDPVSIDQNLTPFVDGVTNVDSFSDWDQPFAMEMDRITERDDEYWEEHRATPKAFVSLATAEKFWKSRFGRYTSIRVAVAGAVLPEDRLLALQQRLSFEIRPRLQPVRQGLVFRPVRAEGLRASVGANDFSQLFLGFSFFLILSAILLAALMFRLGIQQRLAQVGLLEAIGFSAGRARWFFLSEGLFVSLIGALLGTAAATGFAKLMIYGLTHWWIGAVGTRFLSPDIQPLKLILAGGISLILTLLVIWRTLQVSTRRAPRELLAGTGTQDRMVATPGTFRRMLSRLWFPVALLAAVAIPVMLIAGLVPSKEAFGGLSWRVVSFFAAGFAWLASGLLLLSENLKRRNRDVIQGDAVSGLIKLAIANAARNAERSLLTTALIAFATFVIVAVGAGRRNPASEIPDRQSGNGGFTLVAESSQPILFDLNTTDGRTRLELNRDPATTLPQKTSIHGFSVKPGQDASCLNLFQATVPTLLGASPEFIRRGGFRFADTPSSEPWRLLESDLPAQQGVPVIPVIGDMNTLQFSLKKGIGDTIFVPDAAAPEFALQVVGMLDGSVFQGVLVCSDRDLKRVAPEISGQRYFLIETSADSKSIRQAGAALETGLHAFGVDTEPVSQRLAGFLAVQNTYLSTFQLLGGLGLLIGTFGLTAVMMRNVIERRREIALLKALGFTTFRIVRLILIENTVLLLWGIFTGSVSALIAMLPHLLSTGADVPWLPLGATLVAVVLVGSLAALFPITTAARTSIREHLASN